MQDGVPWELLQSLPHWPQWLRSLRVLTSQPFAGAESQSLLAPEHPVTWQFPTVQVQSITFCALANFVAHSSLMFTTSSIEPLQSSSFALHVSGTVPGSVLAMHVCVPPWHWVLPFAHSPGNPVLHTRLLTAVESSTVPLQSLSLPSQTSESGVGWFGVQPFWPPRQLVCPTLHSPCLFGTLHGWPAPSIPSSTVPLQSSSNPLHVSVPACRFWSHCGAPATQCSVPDRHTPLSPVEQAFPVSVVLLSVWPSQLLSKPSQISADAGSF